MLLTGLEAAAHAKATALNAGADDYVTKPFDAEELLARIQSLLRRGNLKSPPVLGWGALTLDPARMLVSYGQTLLHLTPKEFSLLEVLLRRAPNILSARTIVEQGWSALEAPGDETVRAHLKDLRKKLKAAGAPEDFIKTMHRQGYRLNPLYGEATFSAEEASTPILQMAGLKAINEELRRAVEKLQVTQAELQQKNQELEHVRQTLTAERQQLRTTRDKLASQVEAQTQELSATNAARQQQQTQLEALFDHAIEAILIADDQGHYVDANRAASELFAMALPDLLQCGIADFTDPAVDFPQLWQQFIAQGQMSGEFQLHLPSGQIKDVDFNAIANFIPGHHLSIMRDITEQKYLEAQFYQAQRIESLGTLAGGIAHDLNNILTPILTSAQMLRLTQPGLDAKGLELVQLLEMSAKRAASLVKQILSTARASQGERIAIDLATQMQEEIEIIRKIFPNSIRIQIDLPPSTSPGPALGMIFADPTYLHQILLNLCINARDAMPEGGLLTISAAKVFVDEAMAAQHLDAQVGDYVVVTVTDTGHGIAPEVQARMFEPFFTTKTSGQGTGLGLATVRGLVKASDGFVQVFSEVGQTQFNVYFPQLESEFTQPQASSPPPLTNANVQAGLILVVEDEDNVRHMLRSLLESHNYQTLLAQDGAAALEQYRQRPEEIGLVITDIMMPNLDGFALIQELAALNPQLPIIALSGISAHQEAAIATGASCFLTKPFNLETLLSDISTLSQP